MSDNESRNAGSFTRVSPTDQQWRPAMTSEFTMQETAHYYMHRMRRLRDRISQPDYRRSLPDVMSLDSVTAFLDRVARDDLGVFADKSSRQSEAGRKEGR